MQKEVYREIKELELKQERISSAYKLNNPDSKVNLSGDLSKSNSQVSPKDSNQSPEDAKNEEDFGVRMPR